MKSAEFYQIRGTLLVTLSGLLYGVLGYFGTLLLQERFSVFAMLFWRFFIAAIGILPSILFFKETAPYFIREPKAIIGVVLFGILTYWGSSLFYFLSSQYIGTGVAMVIFFSYPIFVTLFAWIFTNWQMNRHAFLSLLAVVMGVIFLKGRGDNALNLMGIFLGMVASISYALYVYGSRHNAQKLDTKLQTFFICLGNAIIFLILSCCNKTFMFPTSWHAWSYILALGIIATAIPIQLLLEGLKYVSPIKASILSVLEPVVTVLVGLALLNETLFLSQWLGILIVLVGAIVIQFEKNNLSNRIEEQ